MGEHLRRVRGHGFAIVATGLAVVGVCVYAYAPGRPSAPGAAAAAAATVQYPGNGIEKAAMFRARLVGGTGTVSRQELSGHAVVMEFWSSWCIPCREEFAAMEQARRELPVDVDVLGADVADGSRSAWAALRDGRVTYPNLSDPSGDIARAYRIVGTPTIVFVDPLGHITARAFGPTGAATIVALAKTAARGGSP